MKMMPRRLTRLLRLVPVTARPVTGLLMMTWAGTLTGCAMVTGSAFERAAEVQTGTVTAAPDASVSVTPIGHGAVNSYQAVEVETDAMPPGLANYVIESGDVLYVSVTGQPDLGSPAGSIGGKPVGSRVDGEGHLQLPLIGQAHVGGLTLREARIHIEKQYSKQLRMPSVVVEVLEFGSKPVYMVGEFNDPGVIYLDRPTTIVQGLALVGGVDELANLRGAKVQRDGRVLPVDIYRLLREGDLSQNIYLQAYDTVFVPENIDEVVFVLGSVEEPAVVNMYEGKLTLSQALAQAKGELRAGSARTHVRVIRSLSPTRGELIVVDFEKITRGEALPFPLKPGDVIYVPRNSLGDWNDTLAEISPSLNLIRDLLQPFVQISVLSDDD